MITREEIENIAMLAKLSVTEEEYPALLSDLQQMIGFADVVRGADISASEADVYAYAEVFHREDKVSMSFGRDQILANAPLSDGEFFVVRKRA